MDGNTEAGRMYYSWAGQKMFIIDHTEVFPSHKGQGVGNELVMAGVKFAREKDLKIVPLCPFAKSMFDRKKDIRDVLFE